MLEGVDHDNIEYKEIRGTKGFKEAVYKVAGMDVKVAVVSGLNNANELLKKIESGEADYHIVEVMCCPGGLRKRRRPADSAVYGSQLHGH